MQKKFVGLMLLSVVASGTTAMAFPDAVDHWADVDINKLTEQDILSGYNDGTFKPNENITRAEASKVLTSALKLEKMSGTFVNINDLDKTHWSYDYVIALAQNGIIKGYPDGTFRPDRQITRAEFSVMIYNILKPGNLVGRDFTDISDSFANEAIRALSDLGIVSGYEDNTFKPGSNITRAEASAMVSRTLEHLQGQISSGKEDVTKTEAVQAVKVDSELNKAAQMSVKAQNVVIDQNEVILSGSTEEMVIGFQKEALKAVVNFEPSFTVRFTTPVKQRTVEDALLDVFNLNYEGSRVQGLSRMSQIENYNGEYYIHQIKYSIKYNRNAEEEAQIDSKVNSIVSEIINQNMSETEKAKTIYDYIIVNTVYADGYKANSVTSEGYSVYSPMAILGSGRAVCTGYAGLFYKMAAASGLEVEYEAGKAMTANPEETHAWNRVKIDGIWKYIDTTWGDNENPVINYAYFLVDRGEFARDHTIK